MRTRWDEARPVPPPVVWERKRAEAMELAAAALTLDEDSLPDQRSWAEIPFGADPRAEALSEDARIPLPWGPHVESPPSRARRFASVDRSTVLTLPETEAVRG